MLIVMTNANAIGNCYD